MKKVMLMVAGLAITGCTSLDVRPVQDTYNEQICVLENEAVKPAFTEAYLRQLQKRGYDAVLMKKEEASCVLTSTYHAVYRWSWSLYLSEAYISIKHKEEIIGVARYRAPKASMQKHGKVEGKIADMVEQLLPEKS